MLIDDWGKRVSLNESNKRFTIDQLYTYSTLFSKIRVRFVQYYKNRLDEITVFSYGLWKKFLFWKWKKKGGEYYTTKWSHKSSEVLSPKECKLKYGLLPLSSDNIQSQQRLKKIKKINNKIE